MKNLELLEEIQLIPSYCLNLWQLRSSQMTDRCLWNGGLGKCCSSGKAGLGVGWGSEKMQESILRETLTHLTSLSFGALFLRLNCEVLMKCAVEPRTAFSKSRFPKIQSRVRSLLMKNYRIKPTWRIHVRFSSPGRSSRHLTIFRALKSPAVK